MKLVNIQFPVPDYFTEKDISEICEATVLFIETKEMMESEILDSTDVNSLLK